MLALMSLSLRPRSASLCDPNDPARVDYGARRGPVGVPRDVGLGRRRREDQAPFCLPDLLRDPDRTHCPNARHRHDKRNHREQAAASRHATSADLLVDH